MRTTVHIDDALHAEAQAAGLNISATLRATLRERLTQTGPVTSAVERLFGALDWTGFDALAHRELALALAQKLDGARYSDTSASAMAAASVARELRAVLYEVAPGLRLPDALDDLVEQRRRRLAELGEKHRASNGGTHG